MRVGHAHGYRMVEFDVKLAADNVAFLLHDATLDRTTSGRGRADALLWRELSRLDAGGWHSAKYAGEPLPTLASIARWARAHGVACNVEIKPTPGRERETGAAVALDANSLWRDADVPPLLSSFSEEALDAARDAVPSLPRALLVDAVPPDWLQRLARLDCVALDADHEPLTRGDRAHRARAPVIACCATRRTTPARVAELAAWGVDGIITDAVDHIAADSLPPRCRCPGSNPIADAGRTPDPYAQAFARPTALSQPARSSAARSAASPARSAGRPASWPPTSAASLPVARRRARRDSRAERGGLQHLRPHDRHAEQVGLELHQQVVRGAPPSTRSSVSVMPASFCIAASTSALWKAIASSAARAMWPAVCRA